MTGQERPLIDRIWDFTKDLSVKVSRQAEKHWKVNTLRVEIASVKHRIGVKYKELGRYVYESLKNQTLEEESYKTSLHDFFDELKGLESQIIDKENRIAVLEQEMKEAGSNNEGPEITAGPPVPPPPPGAAAAPAEEAASAQDPKEGEAAAEPKDVAAESDEGSSESDAAGSDAEEPSETVSEPDKDQGDSPVSEDLKT